MAGRKPKPTALKLIQGTERPSRANKLEPIPQGNLTDAPEWMTQSQKDGWTFAICNSPKGLLKQLDKSALSVWVVSEDLHRQASEKLAQFGLLTKAPNTGLPIQSPYLPIVNKQAAIMLKAASELGFTPSSRTRIQLAPIDEVNPFLQHGKRTA
jgi:P27 family predicted phage terminase small subunit